MQALAACALLDFRDSMPNRKHNKKDKHTPSSNTSMGTLGVAGRPGVLSTVRGASESRPLKPRHQPQKRRNSFVRGTRHVVELDLAG